MPGPPLTHALGLTDWQSFYVLVGSSAAALTGLTFIVITIAADNNNDRAASASARLSGLRVFVTPTAVHFGSALWLSALMSIPGQAAVALEVLLAATGFAGLVYCATLLRRMLGSFPGYTPFASDWIWNIVLPLAAYLALLATGLMLPHQPVRSLYAVGVVVLLLLFIGIRNAWDVVVWMTTERHAHREQQRQNGERR